MGPVPAAGKPISKGAEAMRNKAWFLKELQSRIAVLEDAEQQDILAANGENQRKRTRAAQLEAEKQRFGGHWMSCRRSMISSAGIAKSPAETPWTSWTSPQRSWSAASRISSPSTGKCGPTWTRRSRSGCGRIWESVRLPHHGDRTGTAIPHGSAPGCETAPAGLSVEEGELTYQGSDGTT